MKPQINEDMQMENKKLLHKLERMQNIIQITENLIEEFEEGAQKRVNVNNVDMFVMAIKILRDIQMKAEKIVVTEEKKDV